MAKKRADNEGRRPKRLKTFWRKYGVVLRSWLVFVAAFGLFQFLLQSAGSDFKTAINHLTADLTAGGLWLLGANGRATDALVTSSIFSVRIIFECTAVFPAALLVSAMLAYPCGWRAKLLGVLLGAPALLLFNIIRLVALCYVGHWSPSSFETAHLVVGQAVMIVVTVFVWAVWAAQLGERDEPQSA